MRETLNEVTSIIIGSAVRIHSKLGPGLLESVYEAVLARDLVRNGLKVERQRPLSFEFEGLWFEDMLKPDLIVEGAVIVEIKSVSVLAYVHQQQLLSYLRLANLKVGLLLNFGAPYLKQGIKRIVNNY